ncbi:glycosyltransferase [Salinibacter ruber]|uniref:glycosyltransferase n=1 Tax=Salinibacter ruber TaxID=146919 RepID=UPI002072E7BE|nr:glycosyltransferase [Salinibacter ruber]
MPTHEEQPGLVSIIIPCYNAERYVGEAIESALEQTYDQVEVIVVDDGSTDGSLDVIRSRGDKITWRTTENRGAPAARNHGLSLAKGEYIKFLDADDVLVGDILEKQVEQMQQLDERTIVYGDMGVMSEDGTNRCVRSSQPRNQTGKSVAYFLKNNVHTTCPLHRRHLLKEVDGFDERLPCAQEYDLHLRLCLSGVQFHYEPQVAVYRREHDDRKITGQDLAVTDPEAKLKRVRRRRQVIERSMGTPIPRSINNILARQMWKGGREVLRAGHTQEARIYFKTAQSWSPDRCIVGHPVYRLGVRVLGPIAAEQFSRFRPRQLLRKAVRHVSLAAA